MGSTSNALDKGGRNFKKLYDDSDVTKEMQMDKLVQDSILCSFLWNGITKDTLILMGILSSKPHQNKCVDLMERQSKLGLLNTGNNEVEGLKDDQDGLNEFYRQFPRTTKHAFRDESKQSLFNLTKIYQQIDFNEDLKNSVSVTQGNFQWENGDKRYKSYICA